jgi:signal transduction histidine kinase
VVAAAIALGYTSRAVLFDLDHGGPLLLWIGVNLLAEFLWLPTLTGRATSSMAATVNFAALFITGPGKALWVVSIAAAIATVLIQRRSPLRGVYNLGQMAVTIAAAGWVYDLTGGGQAKLEDFHRPLALISFLSVGLVYFLVNTGLVSAVVGLWDGQRILKVWRENYGYANDLFTSLSLFLLSPLMVLSYLALGPIGLSLFFVPMLFMRNAAMSYIELRQAQEQLVRTERMAAMGEMSAEIGHELANVLQVITARAQMLLTDPEGVRSERAKKAARMIFERVADMRRLTKGLMDFSHRDVVRRRELVNALVRDSVEFVKPQNRFDRVDWRMNLDPVEPEADLDGTQLRQVLLNLFRNAADAMADADVATRWIEVGTRLQGTSLELWVRDSGPGIPKEIRDRIFEPWFTTKPDGHGFGLAVCYRIIRAHGGSIVAGKAPEGGAEFMIKLPARPVQSAAA